MSERTSALEQARQQFRARLLATEAEATQAVAEGFVRTRRRIQSQIDDLVQEITDKGITSPSQLFRLERYRTLLAQTNAELTRLGRAAQPVIEATQERLIAQAVEEARQMAILGAAETSEELARATARAWARLPVQAMNELIGSISDGSPLRAWLDDFGAETAGRITDTLRDGLALGWHPRKIADALGTQVDIAGSRLTLVSRQAVLDSYRGASLRQMVENQEILSGYRWTSAHDARTCLACLALDGQEFPITDEFFPAHAGCRCAPVAIVTGANPSTRETGRDWFAQQPDDVKRQMLPVSAWEPYRRGEIELSDFIQRRDDPTWGPSFQQRPVGQVLGGRAA